MNGAGEAGVRLDKWLWAARFFKTRGLASQAVQGGHVHVNGGRVKPSRMVLPGDEMRITRGLEEFVVTVLALSSRRGPFKEASALYEETVASLVAREEAQARRKLENALVVKPDRRPGKRDRRLIRRFVKGE